MGQLAITLPNVGDANSAADPAIKTALQAIQTDHNSNIDLTNLTTATKNQWLKLAAAAVANHQVNFGVVNVTWPGASVSSNVVTAAHGLGVVPLVAFACCLSQTATGFVAAQVTVMDATNVSVWASTVNAFSPPGGSVIPVGWLAIV